MAPDDCRRLAYHAFGLEDDGVFPAAKLQTAFETPRESARRISSRSAHGFIFAPPSKRPASRKM
jgi:hypothetical protein